MKIFRVTIHYKRQNNTNVINTSADDDTQARQKAVTADRNDYRGWEKKDIPVIAYCEIELIAETND